MFWELYIRCIIKLIDHFWFVCADIAQTKWVARYFVVYSSHPRRWKLYPLILMSPPIGKSVGVMNSMNLSSFLYFLLSKNGHSIIPEFFWAGSKIEIVSSAR